MHHAHSTTEVISLYPYRLLSSMLSSGWRSTVVLQLAAATAQIVCRFLLQAPDPTVPVHQVKSKTPGSLLRASTSLRRLSNWCSSDRKPISAAQPCPQQDAQRIMFVLSTIEGDVRVHPRDLNKPTAQAVTAVIEDLYVDKVIPELGLVTTIYDVLDIQGGNIYPNDGAAFFKAAFRLVVFRPFKGEVLLGKLISCDRTGLRVSLGFFDDIIVPGTNLPLTSYWDDSDKSWVWSFDGDMLPFEVGEDIRVRVLQLEFHAVPGPAQLKQAGDPELGTPAKPFAPMRVIGTCEGDGLGMVSWWSGEVQDQAAAADGEGVAMEEECAADHEAALQPEAEGQYLASCAGA